MKKILFMKAIVKLFALSLIFSLHFLSFSQDVSYENYSVEDGLPSPEVYDMIQDDYGYLWFATDHGLSRYNGYEFENFGLKDGLTNNTIFKYL